MSAPPDPFSKDDTSQYVDYRPTNLDVRSPTSPRSGLSSPITYEDSKLLNSPLSPVFHERMTRRSPLNPNTNSPPVSSRPTHLSSNASTSSRPVSRSSSTQHFLSTTRQQQSNDAEPFSPSTLATLGLGIGSGTIGLPPNIGGSRGSMILYRLADDPATLRQSTLLRPPRMGTAGTRDSVASSSGDSIISFDDSKYPLGVPTPRGVVPYAYDPDEEDMGRPEDDDLLHDPSSKKSFEEETREFPWRGIINMSVLLLLILGLLCLFVFYPVLTALREAERNRRIDGNVRINATGQSPVLFQMPEIIDPDTPLEARSRTGFDGREYELVFSDEFNVDGRSFYPGDDPYWEAVDLWYGVTGDLEWYDPKQVTTKDGALIITIDSVAQTQAGLTHGSTAPFTVAENHELEYRSGMIQTWNKFCFTSGYIEVSVTFPGPNDETAGYWPGAWTMGNLARPGYTAATDGMWPYTYDTCDIGTLRNQTTADGLGPPAALFSENSRSRYNNELSWLSGQRTSACSCPDADHPGPVYNKGRGAPEIDIFEASRDKSNPPVGGTVSQSAQFAPFNHDYQHLNTTTDHWQNFNAPLTRPNGFLGSAVQQSVSGVTRVPSDMFQGSGQKFTTFGFEYWADPNKREDGYIWWQVNDHQTHRMGARSVVADPLVDIGDRLIPEEPMAIILNLGMSPNWQPIDLSTMMFPGEMLVDYVRVYQRKDAINVGCDPKDYPTKKYIEDHLEAYTDVNMTEWKWPRPRSSLLEVC